MKELNMLYELCEKTARQLENCNNKADSAKMSVGDVDYLDKLTHTYKSLLTAIAMKEAEEGGYSERGSYGMGGSYRGESYGYSEARGRGRGARRDSMGRYSSAEDEEEMLDMLERMSGTLTGEKRQLAERFIRDMKR